MLVAVFEANNRGNFQRVFSFLLEDATVGSLEFDAADSRTHGAMPVDLVSFNYAKITVKDDATQSTAVFDLVGNRLQ